MKNLVEDEDEVEDFGGEEYVGCSRIYVRMGGFCRLFMFCGSVFVDGVW